MRLRSSSALRHKTAAAVPRTSALERHGERFTRILDHIDTHLDEWPDIAALAAIGPFSSTHFHFAFSAWTGETLADYLHRRRLEIAALRLAAEPREPVLTIVRDLGFASSEAFTSDFKTFFGDTPSAWRAHAAHRHAETLTHFRLRQTTPGFAREASRPSMPVAIHTLPATRIAYLRRTGPYGPEIGRFWREHVLPWCQENGLLQAPRFGIALDDPGLTPAERCRYDACIEVGERFVANGPAGIASLPGGRYALLPFHGHPDGLPQAWQALLRDWLPGSGQQIDNRPCLTLYPANSFTAPAGPDFSCTLGIPVRPL
jgi:AraC family transcriptional regulator